jgi:hypothetical protein
LNREIDGKLLFKNLLDALGNKTVTYGDAKEVDGKVEALEPILTEEFELGSQQCLDYLLAVDTRDKSHQRQAKFGAVHICRNYVADLVRKGQIEKDLLRCYTQLSDHYGVSVTIEML